MDQHDERAKRAAENESLFRQVNERIEDLNKVFEAFAPYGSWTCECARIDCAQRIELTLDEYESARSSPNRFLIAPAEDHFDADVERVVERTERYWVVEKVGAAAERATELDPRAAGPAES
jgi:hypothetical protein